MESIPLGEATIPTTMSPIDGRSKAPPCQVTGTIVPPPEGRRNFLENAVPAKFRECGL
jgi:hypothetical protein